LAVEAVLTDRVVTEARAEVQVGLHSQRRAVEQSGRVTLAVQVAVIQPLKVPGLAEVLEVSDRMRRVTPLEVPVVQVLPQALRGRVLLAPEVAEEPTTGQEAPEAEGLEETRASEATESPTPGAVAEAET
jgi:hypothetical protein